MKYDCSRVLDYVHERNRMCDTIETCSDCPLFKENENCIAQSDINQEVIDIVQRWSDEHLERPRLTKKEHEFLSVFSITYSKKIFRRSVRDLNFIESVMRLKMNEERFDVYMAIDPTMFPFIHDGESMTFDELLKLEVEE